MILAAAVALAGSSAGAEITRSECLKLMQESDQDRTAILSLGSKNRLAVVGLSDDTGDRKEAAPAYRAISDFIDMTRETWEAYTEALSDVCRDKI